MRFIAALSRSDCARQPTTKCDAEPTSMPASILLICDKWPGSLGWRLIIFLVDLQF